MGLNCTRSRRRRANAPATTTHRVIRPVSDFASAGSRTLGGRIHSVERLTRRHEQSIALRPAEADIATDLWETDSADKLAFRVPHSHATISDVAPGVARAPDVALDVASHAVRPTLNAVDDAIGEQLLIGQFLVGDIEDVYDAFATRAAVPRTLA